MKRILEYVCNVYNLTMPVTGTRKAKAHRAACCKRNHADRVAARMRNCNRWGQRRPHPRQLGPSVITVCGVMGSWLRRHASLPHHYLSGYASISTLSVVFIHCSKRGLNSCQLMAASAEPPATGDGVCASVPCPASSASTWSSVASMAAVDASRELNLVSMVGLTRRRLE